MLCFCLHMPSSLLCCAFACTCPVHCCVVLLPAHAQFIAVLCFFLHMPSSLLCCAFACICPVHCCVVLLPAHAQFIAVLCFWLEKKYGLKKLTITTVMNGFFLAFTVVSASPSAEKRCRGGNYAYVELLWIPSLLREEVLLAG